MVRFGVAAYVPTTDLMRQSSRAWRKTSVGLALALVLLHFARGPMGSFPAPSRCPQFLVAYLTSGQGYYYQIMPAQIFAAVGGIFALTGILADRNAGEARKSPVVPAIVVSAIALLSFSAQAYVYRGSEFTKAISQYRPGAKSFFIASTNVFNGFPLVVRENLAWGSRFPTLWLVPYVADRWQDGPLPDDPIIAYALDAIVTDMQKFHPEVVFIDQDTSQDYIKRGTFDYLKFMNQDSRFAMIWSNYELRGQAGKFAVYVAKSP
jgi:hypothetical protein